MKTNEIIFDFPRTRNFFEKLFFESIKKDIIQSEKIFFKLLKEDLTYLLYLTNKNCELIDLFVDRYFYDDTYLEFQQLIEKYFDEVYKQDEKLKNYLVESILSSINFYFYYDEKSKYLIDKYVIKHTNKNIDFYLNNRSNFLSDFNVLSFEELTKKYEIKVNSNLYHFLDEFYHLYQNKGALADSREKIDQFYNKYLKTFLNNLPIPLDSNYLQIIFYFIELLSYSNKFADYFKNNIEKYINLQNNFYFIDILSIREIDFNVKKFLINEIKLKSIKIFFQSEYKIKYFWQKYIENIENVEEIDLENEKFFALHSKKYVFVHPLHGNFIYLFNNDDFKVLRPKIKSRKDITNNELIEDKSLTLPFFLELFVKKYFEIKEKNK